MLLPKPDPKNLENGWSDGREVQRLLEEKLQKKACKDAKNASKRAKKGGSSTSASSSSNSSGDAVDGEEGEGGGVHVARSLFEEGDAVFCGYDFKQIDQERGRAMIEAASAAGCPSAEAYCHYGGWGGFAVDLKMAFAMFQKIAEKTGF